MAKKVPAYEANDGTLYRCKVKAALRDIEIVVKDIFNEELSPIGSTRIAEKLASDRERVIGVLSDYHRVAPPPPTASASQKSQKGPTSKGPRADMISVQDFSGTVTKIPAGYWWDGHTFRETVHDGEATNGFYDEWYGTRKLFPRYKEDACSAMNAQAGTVHDFRGLHDGD